jgi:hypothetical protein
MVDFVVGEIDPPLEGADWKTAIRERVLSARRVIGSPLSSGNSLFWAPG